MTADSTDELHEFAKRLGLRRSWFQPARLIADNEYTRANCPERIGKPGYGSRDHYDVTESVRVKALRLGAVSVKFGGEPWRERDTWRKGQPSDERTQPGRSTGEDAAADSGASAEGGRAAPEQARDTDPVNDGSRYGQ